jgi:hypothetical protein
MCAFGALTQLIDRVGSGAMAGEGAARRSSAVRRT